LRSLRRNTTYTAINIAGLAIGITAAVFIFLWVHHERSFDGFHPDAQRIYRITSAFQLEDNFWMIDGSSHLLIEESKNEIPEIESTAVNYLAHFEWVTVNNTVFSVIGNAAFVDRGWLEMFHRPVYGSIEAFGNHPFSVALTASEAEKYFGAQQATGKIIRINDVDFTVQVVVKDHPSNSSYRYNIMASIDAFPTSKH